MLVGPTCRSRSFGPSSVVFEKGKEGPWRAPSPQPTKFAGFNRLIGLAYALRPSCQSMLCRSERSRFAFTTPRFKKSRSGSTTSISKAWKSPFTSSPSITWWRATCPVIQGTRSFSPSCKKGRACSAAQVEERSRVSLELDIFQLALLAGRHELRLRDLTILVGVDGIQHAAKLLEPLAV
jgi:hypothetical protein